ncbi:MAG: hypothetical protein RDU14_16955 [Melioribacteraceae bacterium]|nr:hypothetical protein [Melioribacteraceae bacterium]
MSKVEEKISEFVLLDKSSKRYLARFGYTTQKKYAKIFIKEDAEEKKERAELNGVELVIEPLEDKEENGKA